MRSPSAAIICLGKRRRIAASLLINMLFIFVVVTMIYFSKYQSLRPLDDMQLQDETNATKSETVQVSYQQDHDHLFEFVGCHQNTSHHTTNRNKQPKNKSRMINLSNKLLFLHIGKAGGGAVNQRLTADWNVQFSYCHPSPTRCHDNTRRHSITIDNWIRQQENNTNNNYTRGYGGVVMVTLRDPIDRFVSAFYWRQLLLCHPKGDTRRVCTPQSCGVLASRNPEKYCRKVTNRDTLDIMFGPRYNASADQLARALCSRDQKISHQAAYDMKRIEHSKWGIVDWLSNATLHEQGLQLYPIVQEPSYDLIAQVDDGIQWMNNVTRFQDTVDLDKRYSRIYGSSSPNKDKDCQRLKIRRRHLAKDDSIFKHSSSGIKQTLSPEGEACVAKYYQADYNVLKVISNAHCPTTTCRQAIRSILTRRASVIH